MRRKSGPRQTGPNSSQLSRTAAGEVASEDTQRSHLASAHLPVQHDGGTLTEDPDFDHVRRRGQRSRSARVPCEAQPQHSPREPQAASRRWLVPSIPRGHRAELLFCRVKAAWELRTPVRPVATCRSLRSSALIDMRREDRGGARSVSRLETGAIVERMSDSTGQSGINNIASYKKLITLERLGLPEALRQRIAPIIGEVH